MSRCALGVLFVVAAAAFGVAVAPARASVVLLDEHWSPEIVLNDVQATEVDTEATGDPTEAVAGYFSAMLRNESGWPNVRFRGAAALGPDGLPPGQTEARLWYRTDNWDGKWAMEVWLYAHSTGRPVHALTAGLDSGGEEGRLIADDRWHQARGLLQEGPEFGLVDRHQDACYVWLRPVGGWDVPHTTYVDRVEAVIVDGPRKGEAPPRPAQHVRPSPGAQFAAPGVILWEGEDAVEAPAFTGVLYLPNDAEQQRLLSNGAWLQNLGAAGASARWQVAVPEPGTYALWARGFWYRGGFRWRTDGGEWHTSGPDREVTTAVKYADSDEEAWGIAALMVGWTPLGQVELPAGEHTLEVEATEDALGFGFDCWALVRKPFALPAAPAEEPAGEAGPTES